MYNNILSKSLLAIASLTMLVRDATGRLIELTYQEFDADTDFRMSTTDHLRISIEYSFPSFNHEKWGIYVDTEKYPMIKYNWHHDCDRYFDVFYYIYECWT